MWESLTISNEDFKLDENDISTYLVASFENALSESNKTLIFENNMSAQIPNTQQQSECVSSSLVPGNRLNL